MSGCSCSGKLTREKKRQRKTNGRGIIGGSRVGGKEDCKVVKSLATFSTAIAPALYISLMAYDDQ